MKFRPLSVASALAIIVLLQPGGPYKSTPWGAFIPNLVNTWERERGGGGEGGREDGREEGREGGREREGERERERAYKVQHRAQFHLRMFQRPFHRLPQLLFDLLLSPYVTPQHLYTWIGEDVSDTHQDTTWLHAASSGLLLWERDSVNLFGKLHGRSITGMFSPSTTLIDQ